MDGYEMTDTKTPSPSNAEVWSLYLSLPVTGYMPQTLGELARAVLSRWGAQPAVVRKEPTDTERLDYMQAPSREIRSLP